MKDKEVITVHDSHDFHYEVEVQHQQGAGFSTAYYKGNPIAQADAYKLYKPISDDDREWRDQIISELKPRCKNYFDAKNTTT